MGWSNNHPNGLIHYSPQGAYRGYTLLTNVSGHDTRLIDMEGRVCHAWHSNEGIGYAYLLPNETSSAADRPSGRGGLVPEPPRTGAAAHRRQDGGGSGPGTGLG